MNDELSTLATAAQGGSKEALDSLVRARGYCDDRLTDTSQYTPGLYQVTVKPTCPLDNWICACDNNGIPQLVFVSTVCVTITKA